jgi:hypothetical protein
VSRRYVLQLKTSSSEGCISIQVSCTLRLRAEVRTIQSVSQSPKTRSEYPKSVLACRPHFRVADIAVRPKNWSTVHHLRLPYYQKNDFHPSSPTSSTNADVSSAAFCHATTLCENMKSEITAFAETPQTPGSSFYSQNSISVHYITYITLGTIPAQSKAFHPFPLGFSKPK